MKKSSINKLILLGLFIIFLFVESGCTRRKLEAPSGLGVVNISFDWKNLFVGGSIPSVMKLNFYGNNGAVITKDCLSTGFSGSLPVGTYQVLAYNTDVTGVAYRNLESYTSAQVYTPSYTRATYIMQPAQVYGVGLGSLAVMSDETVNQTMAPIPLTKKATLKLTLTGAAAAVSSISSTLSGLVQSVGISDGMYNSGAGSIIFSPSATSSGYESTFTYFGKESATANILDIVLYFSGGGSQTVSIDITPNLTGVIPINIDLNVTIDVTGSHEAGFTGTLKDWNITNRNITI